jgi:hypothetical protein
MKIAGMLAMAMEMAVAAGVPEHAVTVCMRTQNHEVHSAQSQASRMFAGIGVNLKWRDLKQCYAESVVITLASGTPDNVLPGALGNADYEHGRIVIFYDRVRQQLPWKEAYVLAHVLAHEITHALQGISHHSEAGLMKAHWDPQDVSEMVFKPLPFSAEDIELIHRGLDAWESRLAAARAMQ